MSPVRLKIKTFFLRPIEKLPFTYQTTDLNPATPADATSCYAKNTHQILNGMACPPNSGWVAGEQ